MAYTEIENSSRKNLVSLATLISRNHKAKFYFKNAQGYIAATLKNMHSELIFFRFIAILEQMITIEKD